MRKFLLAAALCLVAVGAVAQDVPRYNLEAYCKANKRSVETCINLQRSMYQILQALWTIKSSENRAKCILRIEGKDVLDGELYVSLLGCLNEGE